MMKSLWRHGTRFDQLSETCGMIAEACKGLNTYIDERLSIVVDEYNQRLIVSFYNVSKHKMLSYKDVLHQCSKADVIGVGEHHHGEILSWKYRYQLVKDLKKHYDVVIACETPDFFIGDTRKEHSKFWFYDVPVRENVIVQIFYPQYMPFASSKEHLEYAKKIKKLNVPTYGVDAVNTFRVQHLWDNTHRDVKKLYERYYALWERGPKDSINIRNTIMADVILDLYKHLKQNNKNIKLIYFAHNYHIAFGGSFIGEGKSVVSNGRKEYNTTVEGVILKDTLGDKYYAISTYAPVMKSMWGGIPLYPNYKTQNHKLTVKKVKNLLKGNDHAVISNEYKDTITMYGYTNRHFDASFIEEESKAPTWITKMIE